MWRNRALRLNAAALAVVRYEWSQREKVPANQPLWRALVDIINEIEDASALPEGDASKEET